MYSNNWGSPIYTYNNDWRGGNFEGVEIKCYTGYLSGSALDVTP